MIRDGIELTPGAPIVQVSAVGDKDGLLGSLLAVLAPIRSHDRAVLRDVAQRLKQTDGESWAVGEMLERACLFLDIYGAGAAKSPALFE